MRSFKYNLKRKNIFGSHDNVEDETEPEKKKREILESCDVQIQEEGKTTLEDYMELKVKANSEFAKKSSTSSKSQIIHCLQQTYSNRFTLSQLK